MPNYQKLSNSFLVHSFVWLSILIFIFGVAAVLNFIQEMSQTGFWPALTDNAILTGLGIICLGFIAPSYRLTKSLKILHVKGSEAGDRKLVPYSPLFISDMPQADEEIDISSLTTIRRSSYFGRLVEFRYEENGVEHAITSFVNPDSLSRITNS